jgi:hypothetical protein
VRNLHDGGIRGLGAAKVVWNWEQTLMRGDRLRTLQQFCPESAPSARVRMNTLTDEMLATGLRRQRQFLGIMHRPEVQSHVQRMTADWARGISAEFTELITPPAFALDSTLAFSTDFDLLTDLVLDIDGGYGYFACSDVGPTNSRLVKVSLPDMVVVDELILPPVVTWAPYKIAVDLSRARLYCGDNASPAQLWVVDLLGFEYVESITLAAGDGQCVALLLDEDAGYLYVPLTTPNPAKVIKIRVRDWTQIDSVSLAAGDNTIGTAALNIEQGYVYVGVSGTPGKIVRIRTSDMLRVDSVTMAALEQSFSSAVLDVARDRGFFGTAVYNIAEIRLSDMTRLGAAMGSAAENEDHWRGLAIDRAAGYLYGACSRAGAAEASHVVRFSYPELIRLDHVELGVSDVNAYGLKHDPTTGYLYTCHYTTPGRVARIGGGE